MAVSPGLGITIAAGVSYYRITSLGFRTASTKHHAKVVNGEGAVRGMAQTASRVRRHGPLRVSGLSPGPRLGTLR
jgi:hypothetical protein